MRPSIERELCIGSANCVNRAPGAFALDGERKAVPLSPIAASEAELRQAERACPTAAITLVENGEGRNATKLQNTSPERDE